ncbi:DUF4097 domain-containing protein [Lentzea sp. NPDC060358]|uniref:DUF4097 family beta strand repeat-containing protein n=1 Tax=Lentzea sp. NPDC060358 TaxID=3347103 RepID=UPI003666933C
MTGPGEETGPAAQPGVVRQQSFELEGVAEIDISLISGRVQVNLTHEPGVHVEVRHDPAAGNTWTEGLSSVLSWVSGQFGDKAAPAAAGPEEAVREARVELLGNRLRIESSKALPLRAVPLSVVVSAPVGSHVSSRTGAADVLVTGGAGRLDLTTGTGSVSADRATGEAKVSSGAGTVRLGTMLGALKAKTGGGDVEVSSLAGGTNTVVTGTGDVWLGAVQGNVQVRTGSGDLTVADAASGEIQLGTGSGHIRVGIRQGTLARIDLVSTSGTARSDFDVSAEPLGDAALTVTGRTGSGNALVTAASN